MQVWSDWYSLWPQEDHILQCQEAFTVFDPDNTGLVATKELGNLLRVLGINPTNEELQAGAPTTMSSSIIS